MSAMPDILGRICASKRQEIEALRRSDLRALADRAGRQDPARGFARALAAAPGVAVIAEVKKASPSAGVMRRDFNPFTIARAYERGGATCLSVLTDRPFFQGDLSYLNLIHGAVQLPLLRKDFVLDEAQVIEARAFTADAYLLVVAALEPVQLPRLIAAGRALGMDALVEVHDEAELEVALAGGAKLIGINNRDLHTFQVSLDVTERLAPRVPEGVLIVAESGVKERADVERLKAFRVKAVLVGETLMRSPDIESATRALTGV